MSRRRRIDAMGTRINVLLDHNLIEFRDRHSVLERLAPCLPAALALRGYWHSNDPHSRLDSLEVWRANPVSSRDSNLHRYYGPGSLFLTVTPKAAHVRTGGRWRGFLSIEPLRRVHLAAFRRIADAFGASCMALYADSCEVDDLFWSGRTQEQCIELMERMWGPPQRSVEEVDAWIAAAAERTVPLVWFLESNSRNGRPEPFEV
jgi:hypothetical protein